jgi:multidrug efflux pump subunit AcrB
VSQLFNILDVYFWYNSRGGGAVTAFVNTTCRMLALLWASLFSVLLILMVAFPDAKPVINVLWIIQLAVIGVWATLYCLRGFAIVSAGVVDRKKTAYSEQRRS